MKKLLFLLVLGIMINIGIWTANTDKKYEIPETTKYDMLIDEESIGEKGN